jgi:hypothetical protein
MGKVITTNSGFKVIYDKETITKNFDKYVALFKAIGRKKVKEKVYIHLKTGNEYLVLEEIDMKCPVTDNWIPAVLYEPFTLDCDVKYCRSKESFKKSFALKE